MESNLDCNKMVQNRRTLQWESDLFTASIITDQIGRHEILSQINYKNYNFREKRNSQVM